MENHPTDYDILIVKTPEVNQNSAETCKKHNKSDVILENILSKVGEFGIFQITLTILVNLSDLGASWAILVMVFTGIKPTWKCSSHPQQDNNISTSVPYGYEIYVNQTMEYESGYCPSDGSLCKNMTYSDDDFMSVVKQWNLICGWEWFVGIVTTVQMIGLCFGASVIGQIGDIFGRKKSFFSVYILFLIANLISAFSVNIVMYAAMRFLCGFSAGGILVISLIIPIEYIGGRYRIFGNLFPGFAIGGSLLALMAYLTKDWKTLTIVVSIAGTPYLLSWWFIPESIRWLLTHGQYEEAEKILNRIARMNKKPLPDLSELKELEQAYKNNADHEKKKIFTVIDLLKTWKYAKKTLILVLLWFTSGCVYYGVTFSAKYWESDRYVNLVLASVMDIPGYVALALSYKIGRRYTMTVFYGLGALASLIIPVLELTGNSDGKAFSTLALTSKLSISAGWLVLNVFTAEHFPTVVRNLGMGMSGTGARLGMVAFPLIIELHTYSPSIPYIVFGVLQAGSAVTGYLLKETSDQDLEDFLDVGSENRRGKKIKCRDNDELIQLQKLEDKMTDTGI